MPSSKKRITFYAEPAIVALLEKQCALGYPLSGVIRAAICAAYDPRFKGVVFSMTQAEADAEKAAADAWSAAHPHGLEPLKQPLLVVQKASE